MMSEIVAPPILVDASNLRAVFDQLSAGKLDRVRSDSAHETLMLHGQIEEDGKKVSLWGKGLEEGEPQGSPLIAVAVFPDGRLSTAMIGSVLLPFNNGQEPGINCAVISNGSQASENLRYAKFGNGCDARMTGQNPDPEMHAKGFSDVILYPPGSDVDLWHVAQHLIAANHECAHRIAPPSP